jgi:hypothetical protein
MDEAKGIAAAMVATGGLFLWSGIKGTGVIATLQNVIQGHAPSTAQTSPIDSGNPAGGNGDSAGDGGSGDTTAHDAGAQHNQNLARILLAPIGFTVGQNWQDLLKLWNQESGWNNTAVNPTSGATGIAQALPPTKMPRAAQAPQYNPAEQILWGGNYILQRYGDPSKAWAHEVQFGWY